MRRPRLLALAALILAASGGALAAPASAGTVVYVDATATGGNNGSNWTDAYVSLGSALNNVLPGDQIWIAEGSYIPRKATQPGVVSSRTFLVPGGIELYGGFAGTETSPSQRDILAHPTILSGNVGSPASTADNAFHVVTIEADADPVLIDGLTIAEGQADAEGDEAQAAGLLADNTDVTLRDVILRDHNAASTTGGAAVFRNGSDTLLERVTVRDSRSGIHLLDGDHLVTHSRFENGSDGAALYVTTNATWTIEHTTFEGNAGSTGALRLVTSLSGVLRNSTFTGNTGGGIGTFGAGAFSVEHCLFEGNTFDGSGAAAFISQSADIAFRDCDFIGNVSDAHGGAIQVHTGRLDIEDCRFVDNEAALFGGALAVSFEALALGTPGSRIVGCRFHGNSAGEGGATSAIGGQAGFEVAGSNPIYIGCVFSGNTADRGGVLYANANSNPQMIHCSASGNSALLDGAVAYLDEAGSIPEPGTPTLTVANSVLFGNSDSNGVGQFSQMFPAFGELVVDYSCIAGWDGQLGGTGNHGIGPLFVDINGADDMIGTPDDDLSLSSGSAAIDAGSEALVPLDLEDLDCDGDIAEPLSLDVTGVARLDDDPLTADTGLGSPLVPDMGAYEKGAWTNRGAALAGTHGEPCLVGLGTLEAGTIADHQLAGGLENAYCGLFVGFTEINAPFLLGTLVPSPDLLATFFLSPTGTSSAPYLWPAGVPPGFNLTIQYWIADPAAPAGYSASNAVRGTTP